MKKASILALAVALFAGAQSISAQGANEVTYVADPAQGYLFNKMADNWFITVEGGANLSFAKYNNERDLSDRFAPAAGLYAGKWFSPIIGLRGGVNWMTLKGVATDAKFAGVLADEHRPNGMYKQKTNEIGPVFDVMINLTNWWCGYKPNRVYNATAYVGGGAYFSLDSDWNNIENTLPALRAGLINSFRLSEQVALSLDIRYQAMEGIKNFDANWGRTESNLSAFLGLTYKFKNREWAAPIVPVIPEIENCDVYKERLRAANERIADLEKALQDCLNRPTATTVVNEGPIATVYYPIGVSRLSRENQRVIKAVASQMNSGEYADKNFVLTGWADTYTGTDAVNARLRTKRAEGVKNLLVREGVAADRLTTKSGDGNRMGEGREYVSLGRAVTIEEAR